MSYRTLFIIGNGFDLWHNIPSSYSAFKEYVREHDREVFEAVDSYLLVEDSWNDLEAAFAYLDVDNIVNDLEHFIVSYGSDDWSDAGHHDFQYEVDLVIARLSREIRQLFGRWIRQLSIPTPEIAQHRLQRLDVEALYLNFNYTSTLQTLYGVPESNILHIHGCAELQDSDLILGHAWSTAERTSLNARPDIEDLDVRFIQANEIIDEYFSKTFKPSKKLIQENESFFSKLSTVEEVYVLGHSLSDVDLPYLQKLTSIPELTNANWIVACRKFSEHQDKCNRLIELGVNKTSAFAVSWDDL